MKKGGILNPAICSLLAELGHMDELLIVDAGFALPPDSHVIDLTLTPGIPRFLDVLRAVAEELVIEASWGLGEAVVSGLITPDHLRADLDGRVLECVIGEKDVVIRLSGPGRTSPAMTTRLVVASVSHATRAKGYSPR